MGVDGLNYDPDDEDDRADADGQPAAESVSDGPYQEATNKSAQRLKAVGERLDMSCSRTAVAEVGLVRCEGQDAAAGKKSVSEPLTEENKGVIHDAAVITKHKTSHATDDA